VYVEPGLTLGCKSQVYGEDEQYLGKLFAGNLTYMYEGQRPYDPNTDLWKCEYKLRLYCMLVACMFSQTPVASETSTAPC
jgi:hypothetical protein